MSTQTDKKNSIQVRWLALVIGLIVNAMGNALTISSNMGAAPWTAAEVNLANLFHTRVGVTMFGICFLVSIMNQILIRQWDKWRFFGEVIYSACFSYFIDLFLAIYDWLGIPKLGQVQNVGVN